MTWPISKLLRYSPDFIRSLLWHSYFSVLPSKCGFSVAQTFGISSGCTRLFQVSTWGSNSSGSKPKLAHHLCEKITLPVGMCQSHKGPLFGRIRILLLLGCPIASRISRVFVRSRSFLFFVSRSCTLLRFSPESARPLHRRLLATPLWAACKSSPPLH